MLSKCRTLITMYGKVAMRAQVKEPPERERDVKPNRRTGNKRHTHPTPMTVEQGSFLALPHGAKVCLLAAHTIIFDTSQSHLDAPHQRRAAMCRINA